MTDKNNAVEQRLNRSSFNFKELIGDQLPTRKKEEWKYNDTTFLQTQQFKLIQSINDISEIEKDIKEQSKSLFNRDLFLEPNRLVFVDGEPISALSNLEGSGITFVKPEQLSQTHQEIIKLIESNYGEEKNAIIALTNSVKNKTSLLMVEENKSIKKPIYIIHYASNPISETDHRNFTLNKLVIDIKSNSQVSIFEAFITQNQVDSSNSQLSTQSTLVNLCENATLNHHRFHLEHEQHQQIGNLIHLINRNAQLNSFLFSHGSLLNKTDVKVINVGEGANSQTTGIYLPSHSQQVDFHTCIEHRVPHCNSREVFRGIIADKASATFNGKIHIFKDAQKSDAQLNNKNLLLTNNAEVNTKPELEIYADDVVCAHGATVAKIDENSIFYLKSRGVSDVKARAMISIGFIVELLEYLKDDNIKNMTNHLIQNKLASLQS